MLFHGWSVVTDNAPPLSWAQNGDSCCGRNNAAMGPEREAEGCATGSGFVPLPVHFKTEVQIRIQADKSWQHIRGWF